MEVKAVAGPSNGNAPLTKNAKRRLKKKQQQQQQQQPTSSSSSIAQPSTATLTTKQEKSNGYDDDDSSRSAAGTSILDEAADLRIDPNSDVYKAFSNVLSRYQPDALSAQQQPSKGEVIYPDDEVESEHDSDDDDAAAGTTTHLSKRKQKKLQRLTVAELKQLVPKPEVVEWTDVTSTDPRLLVHLKCVRNSVPIPPHWATKRDYLQNKRGIEKPQYQLPSYIADTGIATMKDALKEKEAEQSLKQKTRERVQPKMGKMDIDYQKLYDAFFKFQHKPHLSGYGDTYYEGKEYETKYKEKRPGQLSKELIEALSIPPLAPPPWLIAMQRYGPPPSYPHLPIAGLNAPIPQGASWGFHPGGWGRPPVDEFGNPLYGNVLGETEEEMDAELVDKVEKEHWGQLEPEESDPEDEQDEDEEQPEEEQQPEQPEEDISGMQSVSSIGAGLQTPSFTELRKDARIESTASGAPRSLYTVLPERAASSSAGQFMSSERTYDLSSTHRPDPSVPVLGQESSRGTKRPADSVAMSINPDELVQHDGVHVDAEQYDVERRQQAAQRFKYADDQDVADVRAQLQNEKEKRHREEERRSSRR